MYRVIAAFSTQESIRKTVAEADLAATIRDAWNLGATAVYSELIEV
jgi:hypothetical protein